MKKYSHYSQSLFLLLSCNKQYDLAMKSADKDFIMKVANENTKKKKWTDALALYERLTNLVAGTDDAPEVVYKSAYANYYDKTINWQRINSRIFRLHLPMILEKKKQLICLHYVTTKVLWIIT